MNPLFATSILDSLTTRALGRALALSSGEWIHKSPQTELGTTAILAAGWSARQGSCAGWFFLRRPDGMFVYQSPAAVCCRC